jgi:hypothetical protein
MAWGVWAFFFLVSVVASAAAQPDGAIAAILAGRDDPAAATTAASSAAVATSGSSTATKRPKPAARPKSALRAEWEKDYVGVAAVRERIVAELDKLVLAEVSCKSRACVDFYATRVSFVEQRRNGAMAAYQARAAAYLSRCEALQEGADKSDCLAVLRAAVTEANAVVAAQRSGVLQAVSPAVGQAGMALYGVLILAAGFSVVLALRAQQVRVHLVLLAAFLFVLAGFRFALSCTTAFRPTPPSIYAWPVLDTVHSIAMTAALAVLALFWGRAVHEELHPNRPLLLGLRVALVAGSAVVSAYGFIMCFVAPNFLVADASGLLFTGFQLVVSVLLVTYAALIVRTVLGVSGDQDDGKRRAVAPNPAAARNSVILLALASLICLFQVVVVTVAAVREVEYLFRVEGELWFQVLRLTAEFLIVSALLAIVILSVWSPQRHAKKPTDDAARDTQLSEPLVPRQYSDY